MTQLHIMVEPHALAMPGKSENAIQITVQVATLIMQYYLIRMHYSVHFCKIYKMAPIILCLIIYILVDGKWGAWASWTTCTESCGRGERTRERECNDPAPLFGGATCSGNTTEGGECNHDPCPGNNTYHSFSCNTSVFFNLWICAYTYNYNYFTNLRQMSVRLSRQLHQLQQQNQVHL